MVSIINDDENASDSSIEVRLKPNELSAQGKGLSKINNQLLSPLKQDFHSAYMGKISFTAKQHGSPQNYFTKNAPKSWNGFN